MGGCSYIPAGRTEQTDQGLVSAPTQPPGLGLEALSFCGERGRLAVDGAVAAHRCNMVLFKMTCGTASAPHTPYSVQWIVLVTQAGNQLCLSYNHLARLIQALLLRADPILLSPILSAAISNIPFE